MKFLLMLLSFLVTASASATKHGVKLDPKRTIEVRGAITPASARDMASALQEMEKDKTKPIDIIFDSPGGDLLFGYLVVDRMESLRQQGIQLRCFVRSVAASMAFQMLLHCDERYATPHAVLLWHPVRVFWMGPLTADYAKIIATQLDTANEVVMDDLRKYMSRMDEATLLWHYNQETLHHAKILDKMLPGFFTYVGDNFVNLHSKEPAEEAASSETEDVSQGTLMYIHETFLRRVAP